MKRITHIRLLFFLLTFGWLTAASPEELITKLQKKYEHVKSFSADFEQLFQTRHSELREAGVLLVKKPGKLYWEYRKPTSKLFITDGGKSYFYVPRYKQIIVSKLDSENSHTPLLFLLGKGNLKSDFSVEFEQDERSFQVGNAMLRLIPVKAQGEFSHIILEINPRNFLIYRLIVMEPLGNRNEYIFTNLKEDVTIPNQRFRIRVPDGVEIIHQ